MGASGISKSQVSRAVCEKIDGKVTALSIGRSKKGIVVGAHDCVQTIAGYRSPRQKMARVAWAMRRR